MKSAINSRLSKLIKLSFFSCLMMLFFTQCKSAARHLELGNYQAAIEKSVDKLKRKSVDSKHLSILQAAFSKANQLDLEAIAQMKQKGDPALWENILQAYEILDQRQKLLLQLKQEISQIIVPKAIDYYPEIEFAKKKASEYLYSTAELLLQSNDKKSAREAYDILSRVLMYYPSYKNANEMLVQAKKGGQVQILILFNKNKEWEQLPFEVKDNITNINPSLIDTEWVKFSFSEDLNTLYDFAVEVDILSAASYFPILDKQSFKQEKIIKEEIKEADSVIVIEKKISCRGILYSEKRQSLIRGKISLYPFSAGLESAPLFELKLKGEAYFENIWIEIISGDPQALNADLYTIYLNNRYIPSPDERILLQDASIRLKEDMVQYLNLLAKSLLSV